MSVIGKRLKEARLRAGLSQEQVGIEADIEPDSASVRMSRYEGGSRTPNPELVEKIAAVLRVPAAYFYASDDMTAALLLAYHRLPTKALRAKALATIEKMA